MSTPITARTRTPAVLQPPFDGRDALVREAAACWDADAGSLAHVSDGASYAYRFTRGGSRFYLRIVPPSWRGRAELEGELAFIDHLASARVPLAAPVASSSGARIEAVPSAIGECLALAFEEAPGTVTDDDVWTVPQARAVGGLMARMHSAALDFALPPGVKRLSWHDELRGVRGQLAIDDGPLRAAVDKCEGLFRRLPQSPDVFGVVHFDLSGDNLVWQGDEPAVIDFDDCMLNWYAADIARTIATFRTARIVSERALEAALIDGYTSVRDLDTVSEKHLPLFVRFALICELGWMLYASRRVPDRVLFDDADELRTRRLIG